MKLPKNLLLSSLLAATLLHATPDCQQTYKVQSFAQRFYVEVLDRQPDNAGLDSWTNDLTSRTKTGADVASGFIFSQEFINKDTNDDVFVTTLYKAFFNREASADPDGFAYWKGKLTEGVSREEVSNGFIYSAEFANLSAEYGIQAYDGAAFTTVALDNFVKRFYTVILGRDADAGGLKSWTDQLSTGAGTGADIAKGFIFSAEYNIDSKSNTQYINDLYAAFFNRTADQAGFDGWISELTSGTPREEVLDGFLGSQEFINLTNSYGILAFEGAPTPDASDNVAPVADAGDDVTLDAQTSFSLSASQSRDDDGTLSCYWWSEGSTLLGETATLTPTGLSVGTHTLRLTVVDDAGVSNSDSVNVVYSTVNSTLTGGNTTTPVVTWSADKITVGSPYNKMLQFSQSGTLVLINAPKGMAIYPNGTVVWTPTRNQVGTYTVTAKVQGKANIVESKIFTVDVLDKALSYNGVFVDLSGVKGRLGTPSSPYGTYKEACVNLNGLQNIYIRGGVYKNPGYHIDYTKNGRYPAIDIQCQGTLNKPLVIRPWGNEYVKLKTDALSAIRVKKGAKYITIENFEIEGESQSINLDTALQYWWWDTNDTMQSSAIVTNGDHLTIRNNTIHDMPGSGISVVGGAYATIEGNVVYNCDWWTIAGSKGIGITQAVDDTVNPANGAYKNKIVGNLIFNIEQRLFSHVWGERVCDTYD